MSENLTPRQQILLWDLISRGGSAMQKDLRPEVKPKDREPLVEAKMISAAKTASRAIELTIEEGGWNHVASTTPSLLDAGDGSKYDRPILQFVVARMQAFAAANKLSYADIFAGRVDDSFDDDGGGAGPAETTLLPLQTVIRSAFFDLAGRPARDGVRLKALRERLAYIGRADLDAALLAMRESGAANLTNLDNPRDIEAEGDAPLKAGRQTFHLVWINP